LSVCSAAHMSTFARSSGASRTPVTGRRPVAGLPLFFCNTDIDFRIAKTTALTLPAKPLTRISHTTFARPSRLRDDLFGLLRPPWRRVAPELLGLFRAAAGRYPRNCFSLCHVNATASGCDEGEIGSAIDWPCN
jgi:hypothetical protein